MLRPYNYHDAPDCRRLPYGGTRLWPQPRSPGGRWERSFARSSRLSRSRSTSFGGHRANRSGSATITTGLFATTASYTGFAAISSRIPNDAPTQANPCTESVRNRSKPFQHPPDEPLELTRQLLARRENLLMGQLLRAPGEAGRHVGDARKPEAGEPAGPRRDHLRHGRHPDGVRAEPREHAHLGRRLERRAEQRRVHALLEGDPLRARDVARHLAQLGVIGVAHVGEALLALRDRTHQRVAEHQ